MSPAQCQAAHPTSFPHNKSQHPQYPLFPSRILKQRQRMTKRVHIRPGRHQTHAVHLNHRLRRNRVQPEQVDRLARFNRHHELLTICRDNTSTVVVVEEAVQSRAVVEDVGALVNDEAVSFGAGDEEAVFEAWVGPGFEGLEDGEGTGVVLHVAVSGKMCQLRFFLHDFVDTSWDRTYAVSCWMCPAKTFLALAKL
jgi:hypothetical protein